MDAAVRAELEPHYVMAVRQDADRTKLHQAALDGAEPDAAAVMTRDFILNGLIPATRNDPDVFRAFFRAFNMLDLPDALMANPKVLEGSMTAHAQKDQRPPAPKLGPERDEFLNVLALAGSRA